jgi:hypothetical protein
MEFWKDRRISHMPTGTMYHVCGSSGAAPRPHGGPRPRAHARPATAGWLAGWGWLGVTRAVWGVCCVGLSAQSQWSDSGEKWVGVGVTLVLACPGRLPDAAVATLCGG